MRDGVARLCKFSPNRIEKGRDRYIRLEMGIAEVQIILSAASSFLAEWSRRTRGAGAASWIKNVDMRASDD